MNGRKNDTLAVFNSRWKANHNENLQKEIKESRNFIEKMYGIKNSKKSSTTINNNNNNSYSKNSAVGKIDNTFFRRQDNFYNANNKFK